MTAAMRRAWPLSRTTDLAPLLALLFPALLLAGCGETAAPQKPGADLLPSVITTAVQPREVASVFEYVGRSEASQRVEVRARVTGVLTERPFEEGGSVEAGTVMFRIDPAEFEARRDSAKASVAKADAAVTEAENNLERYQKLVERDAASIAKLDEAVAKSATTKAELADARAALRTAELDLGYTVIASPIAGRAGRASVDVGNLIGPDSGVLATVVQLDPIYVVFSIGEREYLTYAEKNRGQNGPAMTPRIRLATDELYEHDGKFDLIGNEVDPATGTIPIRMSFPNPDRLLVPGQFVNVVLTSNAPDKRIVVPQASVQENQSGPFVLVVDAQDRVEARPVKTGQRTGPDVVVLEGLEAGETVIVDGIQKVRPGGKVNPTPETSGKTAEADPRQP